MISGASIDRCVRILLTTFYHMHHYTVQLLGRWSSVHYIPLSLPSALIVDNILRELKDVSWQILSNDKKLSSGIFGAFGVLQLPKSQWRKIEAEYSTEDERKTAAVRYWLASDPYASWRRLIRQLHFFEEHAMAKQILCYAEKLTGMTCTLQMISGVSL